jgi:hypothetical protein
MERFVALLLLGGAAILTLPPDRDGVIVTEDGRRVGVARPDGSGSWNLYDRDGNRLGVARQRPDGTVDVYRPDGRRGLDYRVREPKR